MKQEWTPAEFAAIAGISRSTEYRMRQSGEGPPYIVDRVGDGHRIAYPEGSTVLWLYLNRPERLEAAIKAALIAHETISQAASQAVH